MKNQNRLSTLDMIYISIFGIIIAVCSLISIPGAVPFTFQTFGIFLTVSVLGGKRGTLSVLLYIFIGLIGIPVFSGLQGGIGILLGPTGGYIIGFIFSAITIWIFEIFFGAKIYVHALAMLTALAVCYLFGTLWYIFIYSGNMGDIGTGTIISLCIIPFIIPDIIKIVLALVLGQKLRLILSKTGI